MTRRRSLSDEERALWAGIARSVAPLRRSKSNIETVAGPAEPMPRLSPPVVRQEPARAAKSSPLAPLDRRLKQRVARGRDAIDVRIDLHGLTQREAYDALLAFLRRAQAQDARIALIVTGKGVRGRSGERGVLRRQVPLWLALPEFRPFIVGFEEAHVSHGGEGALYVHLRRVRR